MTNDLPPAWSEMPLRPQISEPNQGTPAIVGRIRAIARLHGWAIAVHGSMVRDIDLLGVPWTEDASALVTLVNAIEQVLGLEQIGEPTIKPLGRQAITYQVPGARLVAVRYDAGGSGKCAHDPPHIDMSFMDPRCPCAWPKAATP